MPRMHSRTAWSAVCLAAIGALAVASFAVTRSLGRERASRSGSEPETVPVAPSAGTADVRPAPENSRRRSREEWDQVDEASYQSFPASDPPAW